MKLKLIGVPAFLAVSIAALFWLAPPDGLVAAQTPYEKDQNRQCHMSCQKSADGCYDRADKLSGQNASNARSECRLASTRCHNNCDKK